MRFIKSPNSSKIKDLVSEKPYAATRRQGDTFVFQPRTKFVFLASEMPNFAKAMEEFAQVKKLVGKRFWW